MSIAERLRREDQNEVFVAFSINQLIQKALHLKSRCLAGTSSGLKKSRLCCMNQSLEDMANIPAL